MFKDRGKDSSLQCIKYHLTEARIANCYYLGDNKTVTIFADSERGDHKRREEKRKRRIEKERASERVIRTRKKKKKKKTGEDEE